MTERVLNPANLDPKQMDALARKLETIDPDDPTLVKNPQTQQPVDFSRTAALKEKIAAMERELRDDMPEVPLRQDIKESSFIDELGNLTFYVKNVSNGHVSVSDIPTLNKIPVGKAVDLLEYASVEDLSKSKDLRRAMKSIGAKQLLKRLTLEEYYEEKQRELQNKKTIDLMRLQQEQNKLSNQQNQNQMPHERIMTNPVPKQTATIRPLILSKLGKLALQNDPNPENSKLAMQTIEFIDWVMNENLTENDINYIMGDPSVVQDHSIRSALLQKKAMLKG